MTGEDTKQARFLAGELRTKLKRLMCVAPLETMLHLAEALEHLSLASPAIWRAAEITDRTNRSVAAKIAKAKQKEATR